MTLEFKPYTYPANAIHVSLDLETASLENNAAIVQIGACVVGFPLAPIAPFNSHISLLSCERAGLEVSHSTMEWWDKQDPELRKKVFGGTTTIEQGINEFIGWCKKWSGGNLNRVVLWSKPAQFDLVVLKNATENFREWPFHYRNTGCAATAIRVLPTSIQEEIHKDAILVHRIRPHDALSDAIYQAEFIAAFLGM